MQFLSPIFFYLFLIFPIIIYIDWKSGKQWLPFRGSKLLEEVYGNGKWKYFYLPLFLKLSILSLLICILANPVSSGTREEVSRNGIDIALVFDISKSMLAEDINPNRMSAAKTVMGDFIGHFTSDRLAFVAFAGKAFLSTPLTFDYPALLENVSTITTDSIRQDIPGLSGTAIGDGILLAIDTLTKDTGSEARKKVIILLTDGEANMGMDPLAATKLAREKNIQIYTLGIGNPEGTDLYVTDRFGKKQYFLDQKWTPIRASLDESMLTQIAQMTGGKYYNAKDTEGLASVFQELEKLTKTKLVTHAIKLYSPEYIWFLYGVIFLFPCWLYLSYGRFRGRVL